MVERHTAPITPDSYYTVKALAETIDVGERSIYRAIAAGKLRAAPINARGDLRIAGTWALAWLSALADAPRPPHPRRVQPNARAEHAGV